MTWTEANLSLQLLAEERIGAPMRAAAEQARLREDAAASALGSAVTAARR